MDLRPGWYMSMKLAAGGFAPTDGFRATLARHEGFRALPYRDSRGILTVGIGFNLERGNAAALLAGAGIDIREVVSGRRPLTEAEAWRLANHDLATAAADAARIFPSFGSLPGHVQEVLVNMAYNLGGPKLAGFVNLRAAVAAGDFVAAAAHMLDSRWAAQVGGRATELAAQMRSGIAEPGSTPPPPSAGGRASHPSPSPAGGEVTVLPGDTLSGLAAKHLGSSGRWRELAEINGVTDPRALRPGQRLRLP